MAKRNFLMLAHTYKPAKHNIAGWFLSEKLDGMRCFWDGGITRGLPKAKVPWANTDKDERYKEEQIATGLWSRGANVIYAPDWWLNKLPNITLDGELWGNERADGGRQNIMSIVKKHSVDEAAWKEIKYCCFGSPTYKTIFADGLIRTTNYTKEFTAIASWIETRLRINIENEKDRTFLDELTLMKSVWWKNSIWEILLQSRLPNLNPERVMYILLSKVIVKKGEGVVLRNPSQPWVPERSHGLLKVKQYDDAEGTVTGYITGRKTAKGSKLLGMMGALVIKLANGKSLELSGFTEEERTLSNTAWAKENPETLCPSHVYALAFPIGTEVTYKYRGLSRDGIPQEASYWRKH